ncbi:unnamed protein product [Rotaria sp. Silwood1]|nr:unnamed protein product [Rotaria sp. Silwood1]
MDRTKRKLTFAELSAVKTKKLQNKTIQSITSIENLCDELFYEIFDYLYVNNIYQAFSNLNYRFEQILHASWPLLHYICYHTTSEISSVNDSYKQFLAHNKHKIVSLHLYFYSSTNDLFQFITIDASFSCLESILINENRNDGSLIILLLRHLVCLPRLFFLSICTGKLNDPDNLFQLIFALSQLKSCRFTYFSERDIALPIATRKQHSTIETLALYTVDTWNEILTLTSYTSNLRRLITPCGMDRDIDIETLLPLRLSNLTYLRTCFNYLNFHEFEIFIKKIYSPLKILHVEFLVEDVNFRDSDCWENLILTSLSHLEELYLIYKERFPPSDDLIFSGKLNPFSSPFWIDRRWFFEVETDINFVNYIVRPYRYVEI